MRLFCLPAKPNTLPQNVAPRAHLVSRPVSVYLLPDPLHAVRVVVQHGRDPVPEPPAAAHAPLDDAGATVLLGLALVGLAATRDDTRVTGAYLAFTCALLVWAWQEVAFLLGYVTGPRRSACPAGCTGWRRAGFALQTLLHHELALLVLGAARAGRYLGRQQPDRLGDLRDPLGDAAERQAQRLSRACAT